MGLGLIGKKLGMSHVFAADGSIVPVTVLDVKGNQVLQVKSSSGKDGYCAVQVGFDDQKPSRVSKPLLGHISKHSGSAKKHIREFRTTEEVASATSSGTIIGADLFPAESWVDVIGTTKGKGFQGVVKRYGFAGQPMSHGSMMHRRPGSIGCRLTPGLVWKNQKMPGQMGQVRRTTQNLKVIQSRADEGLLLIAGCVPGAAGDYVVIRPAIKNPAARIAKSQAAKANAKGPAKKK